MSAGFSPWRGWAALARKHSAEDLRDAARLTAAKGDPDTAAKVCHAVTRRERQVRELRAAWVLACAVHGSARRDLPGLAALVRDLARGERETLAAAFGMRPRDLVRELARGAVGHCAATRALAAVRAALRPTAEDLVRGPAGAALAAMGHEGWRTAAEEPARTGNARARKRGGGE